MSLYLPGSEYDSLCLCVCVGVSSRPRAQHAGAWPRAVSTAVVRTTNTLTSGHVNTQDHHVSWMEGPSVCSSVCMSVRLYVCLYVSLSCSVPAWFLSLIVQYFFIIINHYQILSYKPVNKSQLTYRYKNRIQREEIETLIIVFINYLLQSPNFYQLVSKCFISWRSTAVKQKKIRTQTAWDAWNNLSKQQQQTVWLVIEMS